MAAIWETVYERTMFIDYYWTNNTVHAIYIYLQNIQKFVEFKGISETCIVLTTFIYHRVHNHGLNIKTLPVLNKVSFKLEFKLIRYL